MVTEGGNQAGQVKSPASPRTDPTCPGKELGSGKLDHSDLDESEFCPNRQHDPGKSHCPYGLGGLIGPVQMTLQSLGALRTACDEDQKRHEEYKQ